jgi:hypothetical protein
MALLRQRDHFVARLHPARFQTLDGRVLSGAEPGTPDFAALIAPPFLLEVKRPGGVLSDVQQAKIREIESLQRLPVAVASSPDELAAWLDARILRS